MAYTTIDDPEKYFQPVIYTGNGSADHAITLPGDTDMQPDLVWIKNRDAADAHCLYDSVRGVTKHIQSNDTSGQATDTDTLDAFQSDGFKVDGDNEVNTSSEDYVAWCWKESADAGFDIIAYAGDGSAGRSLSHGLSATPHWIIVKNLDDNVDWFCYHRGLTDDYNNKLNTTDAEFGGAYIFDPTSSIFKLRDHNVTNDSGDDYIAYAWAEKKGFSKFGTIIGNGDIDGPFIYTGFKPAYVLIKAATTANSWYLQDNKRSPFNLVDKSLYPHVADAEESYTVSDFLSNGFKLRTTNAGMNNDGVRKIFIAFAESPFVNSNGVPNNAR